MIVGINATKDAVFLAETNGDPSQFSVQSHRRIVFSLSTPQELTDLLDQLGVVFNTLSTGDTVAILKCSSGMRGSSVQAIKAETVAEIAAAQERGNYRNRTSKPEAIARLHGAGNMARPSEASL